MELTLNDEHLETAQHNGIARKEVGQQHASPAVQLGS